MPPPPHTHTHTQNIAMEGYNQDQSVCGGTFIIETRDHGLQRAPTWTRPRHSVKKTDGKTGSRVLVGPHKGVVLKKLTSILSTCTKFLIMCSCNCLVADLSLHPWREKIQYSNCSFILRHIICNYIQPSIDTLEYFQIDIWEHTMT